MKFVISFDASYYRTGDPADQTLVLDHIKNYFLSEDHEVVVHQIVDTDGNLHDVIFSNISVMPQLEA